MRKEIQIPIHDLPSAKSNLLYWANRFPKTIYLDSNQYTNIPYYSYECIIAADPISEKVSDTFTEMRAYVENTHDWLFGFISYDMKNDTEELKSNNPDMIQMPLMHFFCPRYIFFINPDKVNIHYHPDPQKPEFPNEIKELLDSSFVPPQYDVPPIALQHHLSKEIYIETIQNIKQHIQRGDIFEMNFCQEFFAHPVKVNPFQLYARLNDVSPTPFSCYYRYHDRYLLSASPERFLTKNGQHIITQPIKGTIRRGINSDEDHRLKRQLYNDPKERAENVMIVDLVRNDLTKTALKGSVQVDELCGIYTFSQVHQMISSIRSIHDPRYSIMDTIQQAFPMGSMTGAPKVKAMELIEYYEQSGRGLYSGTVGYITPEKNFDFNVIIRSFLYNQTNEYLSFHVGGAITANSDPEQEYAECLVKAKAMMDALNIKI